MSGPSTHVCQTADQIAKDLHLESLTAEEEALLAQDLTATEKRRYLSARNLVLYIWRSDVKAYVARDAVESHPLVTKSLVPYARIAWQFLDRRGYINFGLAEEVLARTRGAFPSEAAAAAAVEQGERGIDNSQATDPELAQGGSSVVIIGAGLAGLAAAHQLQKMGHKVLVVEAKSHPGGRVHTVRLHASGQQAVADLGGAVITGVNGNPLAVLARQLDIPLHKIDADQDDCPLYQSDGKVVDRALDEKASALWMEAEEDALGITERYRRAAADAISYGTFMTVRLREAASADARLSSMLRWLYTNAEFSAAALATELSVTRWADDDQYGYSGDHAWVPGGNARIINALAREVPVLYQTPIAEVRHGDSGVTLVTSNGRALVADACVVTVPLGVLKAGAIHFHPPLPKSKLKAIDRLGFGVLNKVVLLFPYQWWESRDTFGHVAEGDEDPGWFYLWYCFPGISGGHMIAALVSGKAAIDLEALSDEAVLSRVMARLRKYHPRREVPDPIAAVVTQWGQDPFARGAYSSVPPGCAGADDYREMAECVGDRLFFAGEATTYRYPAQMHGAYDSGLREAAKVHAVSLARRGGRQGSQQCRLEALEGDTEEEVSDRLMRAVRLACLLEREFELSHDCGTDAWQAIVAVGGVAAAASTDATKASTTPRAVLRIAWAELPGLQDRAIPPAFYIVPLEVVIELMEGDGSDRELISTLQAAGVEVYGRSIPSQLHLDVMEQVVAFRNGGALPPQDGPMSLIDSITKPLAFVTGGAAVVS